MKKSKSKRESPGTRLSGLNNNTISWKPVKSPEPGAGSYEMKKDLVLQKSPRAAMGKEKLKSFLDDLQKKKQKIPGVGDYDINPCYRKIARPMKTTRW